MAGMLKPIPCEMDVSDQGRERVLPNPKTSLTRVSQKRLKMEVNHDDFAHLKIPLEDVISATNNFGEENLFCKHGFANEYKGQLSWSGELVNILARRLNKERKDGEQQFWMEISMLSSLKHKKIFLQ
ncbi:receptor-like tyrosine-protein kinase kin-15 [Artemisia annua]|uniref:Receptor-like tyrosine-protein kinase kin-15 n=1 Tax=Artemisia annua TaxID=35608 RepID=A0A2U1NDX8_ARTAN|nr:receptor-like tyrosine-protein kinase kin-15 [Artemisia annua]